MCTSIVGASPYVHSALLILYYISSNYDGLFNNYSAMPRGPLKKLIQLCITEDYYRPLYTFVSSLQILLIYYFWIPIPVAVWDLQIIILRMAIYCEFTAFIVRDCVNHGILQDLKRVPHHLHSEGFCTLHVFT